MTPGRGISIAGPRTVAEFTAADSPSGSSVAAAPTPIGTFASGRARPDDCSRRFDTAYREHHLAVYRLAAALVGRESAADVTQDVFVRLWRHPDRFDAGRGTMRTYLLAITHNVAIDHLRSEMSRSTRQERVGREEHRAQGCRTLADPAVLQDTAARVHLAVDGLPPEMRESIVTAFYGGLTYRETADVLGHQEGTVKSRIRKGLIRLRRELDDLTAGELEPS